MEKKDASLLYLIVGTLLYTCSLVDEILELVMTKGLADADGPQFHLLFFRHRKYLISHRSSSQDLLLSMNIRRTT